jgi:hypothetical protein
MNHQIDKYAFVSSDEVLLEHQGPVSREVLLDILPKIEDLLADDGVKKQKLRKIINISIEALQNLQLHSFPYQDCDYTDLPPMFILTSCQSCIGITIGNLIANDERTVLQDKLNKINSLNDEEIKFLYGVIMKQTVVKFSTKGGAGLGLIDMKKKSGNPLEFGFQDIDEHVSYFNLKICVAC